MIGEKGLSKGSEHARPGKVRFYANLIKKSLILRNLNLTNFMKNVNFRFDSISVRKTFFCNNN